MDKKLALKTILIISIIGIIFSGYLSYSELSVGSCALGGCSNVGGVPACVYGLGMYILVCIISIIGISSKK